MAERARERRPEALVEDEIRERVREVLALLERAARGAGPREGGRPPDPAADAAAR